MCKSVIFIGVTLDVVTWIAAFDSHFSDVCHFPWLQYFQEMASNRSIEKLMLTDSFLSNSKIIHSMIPFFISNQALAALPLLGFEWEWKTPAPLDSYSRNSTKNTVDPNTTIPQTSPPWWGRLPLLRRGIYGSARSDVHNLFKRGWARALRLGLI